MITHVILAYHKTGVSSVPETIFVRDTQDVQKVLSAVQERAGAVSISTYKLESTLKRHETWQPIPPLPLTNPSKIPSPYSNES